MVSIHKVGMLGLIVGEGGIPPEAGGPFPKFTMTPTGLGKGQSLLLQFLIKYTGLWMGNYLSNESLFLKYASSAATRNQYRRRLLVAYLLRKAGASRIAVNNLHKGEKR